jgi:hypothetical protein
LYFLDCKKIELAVSTEATVSSQLPSQSDKRVLTAATVQITNINSINRSINNRISRIDTSVSTVSMTVSTVSTSL